MTQLSTEVQPRSLKSGSYYIDNINSLLTAYFMEVDESKLEAVALLLTTDELPTDPILHPLYNILQDPDIKQQVFLFLKLKFDIFGNFKKNAPPSFIGRIENNDNDLKCYEILMKIYIFNDEVFSISKCSLNMLSATQAKAVGLALSKQTQVIHVLNPELLFPLGWIALEKILRYSKITSLVYHSDFNEIIPNLEAFEMVLGHLSQLGLSQEMLVPFIPRDWQLLGEAFFRSKLKMFFLAKSRIGSLDLEQLKALNEALSLGQVTHDVNLNDGHTIQAWQKFGNEISYTMRTSLDLRDKVLGCADEPKWEAILTATLSKSNVTSLNLAGNYFNKLSKNSWDIFAKILAQSKVTHLDMSDNFLAEALIFEPILAGSRVTDLDLGNNHLDSLEAFGWQLFWINILSGSNVIRLNLGNLSLDKLPVEQWRIFCDIIRNSKVRVVNLEKPAVVEAVHEKRSKELSIALANKKGTLAGLIRHTLWNVYQMKVERADPNSDNNNAPLLVQFEKDGQSYESIVEADDSKVLGEASDYSFSLQYT